MRFRLGLLLVLVALALASSGCSVAAAAAGANSRTVSGLADLDGVFIGALASAIGGIVTAAAAEAERDPPIRADAHLCWLDPDGGVEIYAPDEPAAEAMCRARWGSTTVCRCHAIGPAAE